MQRYSVAEDIQNQTHMKLIFVVVARCNWNQAVKDAN